MKKGTDLREWVGQQYRPDPKLKRRVEELVTEMEIEQGLVALREERGVPRTALAKMIGVSQPAIAKLESGRTRNVEIKTLVRYAAALGGRLKVDVVREPRGRGERPPRRARSAARTASSPEDRQQPLQVSGLNTGTQRG